MALVDQSLSSDELSSYWNVTRHTGFGGVLDAVHTDAEITPPLYFLLAKLTTQIDATRAMIRLPSLLAGTATIPLTYLVGERTLRPRAAGSRRRPWLLSPFMIYLSAEARSYALVVFLRPALDGGPAAGPGRRRGGLVGALRLPPLVRRCTRNTPRPSPLPRRRSGRFGRIPAPAYR